MLSYYSTTSRTLRHDLPLLMPCNLRAKFTRKALKFLAVPELKLFFSSQTRLHWQPAGVVE